MCLLGLLLEWKDRFSLKITVVHVNHGIRGEEADRDEQYVRDFCLRNNVDFRAVRGNIPELAPASGCTEEEAGRNFRYRVFKETAQELGYNKIAVAHNRSDNAETVIFNLLRGSGIAGISGMDPSREMGGVTIIRPLLSTPREDIEKYLEEAHIGYCTDSTNFDTKYSRNAIRNEIMPLMREKINSRAEEHIVRLAEQASQIEDMIGRVITELAESLEKEGKLVRGEVCRQARWIGVDICALSQMEPLCRNMLLRRIVGELAGRLKDITNIHIDSIAALTDKEVGKKIDIPYGITARRDYGELILEKNAVSEHAAKEDENAGKICIIDPDDYRGAVTIPLGSMKIRGFEKPCLRMYITGEKIDGDFTKNLYTKFFDCDTIKGRISVRTRRSGDYLLIRNGEGGFIRKSLKSWMIDSKIPAAERDRILLVAEDDDHILWVVGRRRDDSCLVNGRTGRTLVAEITEGSEAGV